MMRMVDHRHRLCQRFRGRRVREIEASLSAAGRAKKLLEGAPALAQATIGRRVSPKAADDLRARLRAEALRRET